MTDVELRDVNENDLPIFFEQQQDPAANWMAAFTAKDPTDRAAFTAKWARILGDDSITKRTILSGGQIAGNIGAFVAPWSGKLEVTYWIGREFWGRGIATQALAAFLSAVTTRPLYARAARDNIASLRVLEKCGFTIAGYERGFCRRTWRGGRRSCPGTGGGRRRIIRHCDGPAGKNGPFDPTRLGARLAAKCWSGSRQECS